MGLTKSGLTFLVNSGTLKYIITRNRDNRDDYGVR